MRDRLRRSFLTLAPVLLAASAWSQEAAPASPPIPAVISCSKPEECGVSKRDFDRARKLFEHGLKSDSKGDLDAALEHFQQASDLVPRNVVYATAREMTRQRLVLRHMQDGNRLLERGHKVQAIAELRAATELDPANTFARERLLDAAGLALTNPAAPEMPMLRRVAESEPITLRPQPGVHTFRLREDARTLLSDVARAYGISTSIDETVRPVRVRFDVDKVDFATAMDLAGRVTKTFAVPLTETQALIVPDDPQSRQQYERMEVQHFYVAGASTPQDLNEIMNVMRGVFEVRFMTIDTAQNGIVVRAPKRLLDAASAFVDHLAPSQPQVMFDVRVYQVSHSAMRRLGMTLPLQFNMFNLSSAALAAALGGGGNLQSLINQLIASGGINQANSQGVTALLAQLQNQQGGILSQPFATFGGGTTRFGVAIPSVTANFSFNRSDVQILQHLTLRAQQNNAATFLIGSRYPILNASFAPIFNTSAISRVIGNGSFQAPFPSFTYEDLGLTVKATPTVHADREVSLKLEMKVRSLTGQSFNAVPVISNREYQGSITVKNGEAAVVAGSVSEQDQRSLSGIPGLTHIPGAGLAFSTENRQFSEDELLITITPNIISNPVRASSTEVIAR
jgi:general secretion pathway protein D